MQTNYPLLFHIVHRDDLSIYLRRVKTINTLLPLVSNASLALYSQLIECNFMYKEY